MDVTQVAKLANLILTPAEVISLTSQLESILTYVSQLKQQDVANVLPTSQSIELKNISRVDTVGGCLAPNLRGYQVPGILENA